MVKQAQVGGTPRSNENKDLEQSCFDKSGRETYHNALMSGALPEYLDLMRVGQVPVRLTGQVRLDAMPRLRDAVTDTGGEAAVDLQAFDEAGHKVVQGQARAALDLICQRCFGKLSCPVTAVFNLIWVRSEADTARLPEAYEPLVSITGNIKLTELVEDELLLALPMVALHEPSTECSRSMPRGSPRRKKESIEAAPAKPFAALKALKRR